MLGVEVTCYLHTQKESSEKSEMMKPATCTNKKRGNTLKLRRQVSVDLNKQTTKHTSLMYSVFPPSSNAPHERGGVTNEPEEQI